jgi:hypothetical protein
MWNHPAGPKVFSGAHHSFRISCGNRIIVRRCAHGSPEGSITGEMFQYALCGNNVALGNPVYQFV